MPLAEQVFGFKASNWKMFIFSNLVDIAIVHRIRENLDLLVAQEQKSEYQQNYLDYFSHLTLVEVFKSEFGGPCVRPRH